MSSGGLNSYKRIMLVLDYNDRRDRSGIVAVEEAIDGSDVK
jgi:hypothetical protein